jgi:hypothetical protein
MCVVYLLRNLYHLKGAIEKEYNCWVCYQSVQYNHLLMYSIKLMTNTSIAYLFMRNQIESVLSLNVGIKDVLPFVASLSERFVST